MKRTLSLIGLLVLGVMLLFNPDTGVVASVPPATVVAEAMPSTTTGEPPPTDPSGTESMQSTTSTTTEPPSSTSTTPAPATYSVLGDGVPSEFGIFQVEIVIESGEMVDIVTISEPSDRKSRRINDDVIPLYEEAAISTQSADIDVISGATVTWGAYTASIQSAMDEAGL
ncbi:MAG: FMN-binding protein [Actinomycetia bacterium]|nr:FMN-binding protein [Actinomycetes bacterium]